LAGVEVVGVIVKSLVLVEFRQQKDLIDFGQFGMSRLDTAL
jgi:hypothetical protein